MNKKIQILIIIIALILTNCAYDPPPKNIKVYNNTDSPIYVYCSCTDSISNTYPLHRFNIKEDRIPSTVLGRTKYKFIGTLKYRLNPYSWGSLYQLGQKSLLESCPGKKIRVFYISDEIMQTKSWNEIVSDQLYIKKEIFGIRDLEPYDWTIEYNK